MTMGGGDRLPSLNEPLRLSYRRPILYGWLSGDKPHRLLIFSFLYKKKD